MEIVLNIMTDGKFPFASITKVIISDSKHIFAPKFFLYPKPTEAEQIESAKKAYGNQCLKTIFVREE